MELLLTALSALVGGGAGAWAALERFKRERAFDRRLDWYEDAVSALHSAGMEIVSAVGTQRAKGAGEAAEEQWKEAARAMQGLVPVISRAELFARSDSVARIRDLYERIGPLGAQLRQARRSGGGVNAEVIRAAERIAHEYAEAAADLSAEARDHLGLSKLDQRITYFSGPSE